MQIVHKFTNNAEYTYNVEKVEVKETGIIFYIYNENKEIETISLNVEISNSIYKSMLQSFLNKQV